VFTWVPLQRWLLVIGLVMVAGGQWVFLRGPQANPFFPVLSVLGPVIALIGPIMVSGVVLRALSAPRTLMLVPHGRLQLLLGVLWAELLMAGAATMVFAVLRWEASSKTLAGVPLSTMFLVVMAAGTLICFALFFATSGRYGWIAGLAIIAASRPLEWLLARHELLGVTSNPSPAPVAAVFITISWALFRP